MNYTVKFVVIIGIVAVLSFFTASVVIPEKNAVAPSRKKSAPRALTPLPTAPRGGDIPIVVADGKPAEKPILVSGTASAPIDHNAFVPAPAVDEPDTKVPPAVAVVDAKVQAPAVAPVAPPTPPVSPVAPPPPAPPITQVASVDAKPATFSTKVDTALLASAPFAGRTIPVYDVMKSVPPNTMAARLLAEMAAAGQKAASPAAPAPAAPVVQTSPSAAPVAAAASPDTVVKRRPDPSAPLGYRLVSTAVCSGIENRVPSGVGDRFSKESGGVYYYTHFVGATDSAAVLHRWYRDGKLIQTSILQIKSASWRTHSKRNFASMDDPSGNWRVEVIDQKSGKVLESASFVVE